MKDDMSRREFSRRLVKIAGGSLVALVGVPLLILPGPGVALILVGADLVGEGLGLDVRGFLKRAVQRLDKELGDSGKASARRGKAGSGRTGRHAPGAGRTAA